MKKVLFKHAEYITSAYQEDQLPVLKNLSGTPMPEIALVGRSNVGKSSLINHLLQKPKLAKTSATPGKTQSINFFTIDQQIALVDLPGYGYAKVSKETREGWSKHIDQYLEERAPLRLILLLLDIRHPPTDEDYALMTWAQFHGKPLLAVFTKADKLKPYEIDTQIKTAFQDLSSPPPFLSYSIKSGATRIALIHTLNTLLHGTSP